MTDGLTGVGKMPFNEVMMARERIENHLIEQRVEKQHRANHRHLEALQKQRLDLLQSYDKFGAKTIGSKPEGTNVNIKV